MCPNTYYYGNTQCTEDPKRRKLEKMKCLQQEIQSDRGIAGEQYGRCGGGGGGIFFPLRKSPKQPRENQSVTLKKEDMN